MMKQFKLTIMLTMLISMVGVKGYAHDIEVKNNDGVTIYYNWINNKTELSVSHCGNTINSYSGNVVIPKSVEYNNKTYSVTSIGKDAFEYCTGLTSVIIPNSVTSIGSGAFYRCTGLTSVTIPNSVTSIGNSAFYRCTGLTSVTIPNSVTSFGENAFLDCLDLIAVNISDLEAWFKISFKTFSENPLYFAHHLFLNGEEVKELIIPNSVTSIGDWAFCGCTGLTSVTIPKSVTTIVNNPFWYTGLSLIMVESGNPKYDSRDNCNAIIETNTNKMITGCKNTIIPNSVTSIGDYAFYYCTDLASIIIPNSVTSIGVGAFIGCNNLASVVIGVGVTSISDYSFPTPRKTIWLTNTPPSGYKNASGTVNYVSNDKFNFNNQIIYKFLSSYFDVNGVRYVPVSPSDKTCDAIDCVYDESAATMKITSTVDYKGVSMKVQNVQPYTACNNQYIKNLIVDNDGIIANNAFASCTNMKSVTLGANITAIGKSAFQDCSSIEEIDIPSKVEVMNESTFSGCTSLKSIMIKPLMKDIKNNAFYKCTSLKEVNIADSETELNLGSNVELYYPSEEKPLFSFCPLETVYIGRNINYNKSSKNGYSPFYRNTSLRSVTIMDKETEISENEFYGCTSLKNVSIGDGVETIGNWAFSGCSSLDYFAFGSALKTIGKEAFSDCTAVKRIISKAMNPPSCGTQALDDINKWDCVLSVPQGALSAYQAAEQWKEFFFINENTTGIHNLTSAPTPNVEGSYYILDGQHVGKPKKGVNIIKMSDGSTKKVLVK